MINSNRVVPVTQVDLLTLYGNIMKLDGTSISAIDATDVGEFSVTGSGDVGNKLAAEPIKSLDFASGVTAAVIYFIPAYDYKGFTKNGSACTMAGADVVADGRTFYKGTLSSSTVTIAKVGF